MSFFPGQAVGKLLGAITYDPGTLVTKALTALLALTAFDTTNLRLTFTAPASGKVRVRLSVTGEILAGALLALGVLDGSTVRLRQMTVAASATAEQFSVLDIDAVIGGLTPGNSYTWDAAYGVEVVAGAGGIFEYGGPNNTTADDAAGAICFEVWEVLT